MSYTNKSNKNYLIIGHSGVGKSSLINYLTFRNDAETGCGNPCTKEGEWQKVKCKSPSENGGTLTFIDSCGLEEGENGEKSEYWKDQIREKLVSEWNENAVCGVIHCFSYILKIQDFELNLIKSIIEQDYNVLIIFTNSDCSDYKTKKDEYHGRIKDALKGHEGKYDIADVCSIEIRKITGKVKPPSGRDEVLEILTRFTADNLYRIYCNALDKIEAAFNKKIEERLSKLEIKTFKKDDIHPLWKLLVAEPAKISASVLLSPFWVLSENSDADIYNRQKKIFEDDFNALRFRISQEIKRFGDVFGMLYNASFETNELSLQDKLYTYLSFGGGLEEKINSLSNIYRDSLINLQKIVHNNIYRMKQDKKEVKF